MAKKKPHLRKSKLESTFDIDSDVPYTKKYPLQDGVKVYKTAKSYEVVYQERGAQYQKNTFATKAEAEQYLRSLGRK